VRVLHVTTDPRGGAGLAARRLVAAQREIGLQARLLVKGKPGTDSSGLLSFLPTQRILLSEQIRLGVLRRLPGRYPVTILREVDPVRSYARRSSTVYWSCNHLSNDLPDEINRLRPDLVHLHWVGDQFFPLDGLRRLKAPVCWTLHDCWAFTGGCHYPGDCRGFTRDCGSCPALGSTDPSDLSRQLLRRKKQLWSRSAPLFIAPSRWMEHEVRESSLWAQARLRRIPNCLDLGIFRPVDAGEKSRLRRAAGLDPKAICLIFGAFAGESDPRKGGDLLISIIEDVASRLARHKSPPPVQLAVFGASTRGDRQTIGGIPVTGLGTLRDEQEVACALQCADLLLLPSRQDNLPNAGLEASACGLPLVSFDIGGLPDIVENHGNGYRLPAFDCAGFAAAVVGLILDHGAREAFGLRSRKLAVENFGPDVVARRHEEVYREQFIQR